MTDEQIAGELMTTTEEIGARATEVEHPVPTVTRACAIPISQNTP
jgi:hypothetical protein